MRGGKKTFNKHANLQSEALVLASPVVSGSYCLDERTSAPSALNELKKLLKKE